RKRHRRGRRPNGRSPRGCRGGWAGSGSRPRCTRPASAPRPPERARRGRKRGGGEASRGILGSVTVEGEHVEGLAQEEAGVSAKVRGGSLERHHAPGGSRSRPTPMVTTPDTPSARALAGARGVG